MKIRKIFSSSLRKVSDTQNSQDIGHKRMERAPQNVRSYWLAGNKSV